MKTGRIDYHLVKSLTEQFGQDLGRVEDLIASDTISDHEISEIMSGLVAIKEIIEFLEEIHLRKNGTRIDSGLCSE